MYFISFFWGEGVLDIYGPLNTTPEEFKNATVTIRFGFAFERNSVRELS